MFHPFASLLLESAVLVAVVTVAFWAIVGVVAADRTGRSRRTGALAGGLLPGLGWVVLLLPSRGGEHRHDAPPSTAPVAPAVPAPTAVAPLWGPMPGATAAQATGTAPFWSPSPSPAPFPAYATPPAAPQPTPTPAGSRRRTARASWAVTAVGTASVACLLVTFVDPWLDVDISHVTAQAYAGGDSLVTGVPLAAATLLLAAVVLLQTRRPRGTWCVIASSVGLTTLLIGMQLWLFTRSAARLLHALGSNVSTRADAHTGTGALLLCLSGLLAVLWSVLSLLHLEKTS